MLRVTVLERGRIVRARDDHKSQVEERDLGSPAHRVLPQRLYDRLMRVETAREERSEKAVFSWRRNHCLVGQWVGVMQIPGLQLEILPKTDEINPTAGEKVVHDIRSNLMEMLLLGGLGTVRARGVANLALKHGNLHDQLVDVFLDRTLYELQRGLDRSYTSEEDNVITLRGKLVLSRHVARNAAQKTRFFCRHDVLSEATPISVRLRQACRVLASRIMHSAIAIKCQQVLAVLHDVPDMPFRYAEPAPIFTRQNDRFADIFQFATMLLEGKATDAKSGEIETFSLLFDMERVFERYIASIMVTDVIHRFEHLSLYPQAKGHRINLYHDKDKPILNMKPDLLFIQKLADGKKTFIIDTKWKRLSSSKNSRPTRTDLYQLYAYLRSFECECVYLLYPEEAGLDPRNLQAHTRPLEDRADILGLRFVNLNRRLWTRDAKRALADELAEIVKECLNIPGHETAQASA